MFSLNNVCFTHSNLMAHVATNAREWDTFASSEHAETCIPKCWSDETGSAVQQAFAALLIVQAVRPERIMSQADAIVSAAVGPQLLQEHELVCLDARTLCLLMSLHFY